MKPSNSGRQLLLQTTAAAVISSVLSAAAQEYTTVKPYAVAVSADYVIQPLLTVGDQVPNTSDPARTYQLVGSPDGLGAVKGRGNTVVLYVNHEFPATMPSRPDVGGPTNRGAIVSRFVLDRTGKVISGERAYDLVYHEETGAVLPAPEVGNTTRGLARYCSGSLSYQEAGFDRPIYFANEESGGTATFDGKGGLAVAIFDKELHTLVKLGRFSRENTLIRPDAGEWTVAMGMEDGPATLDNQLYLYLGRKDRSSGASVLSRNGLDTGRLYTFVCDDPAQKGENTFTNGFITGRWVELPDQTSVSDTLLEAQSDAVGAFPFVRIEDGAWSKRDQNKFYFVTTGSGAASTRNVLGRAYEVRFDKRDILGTTRITLLYHGDAVAAAGADIGFAPDNLDVSKDYLMIQEDGSAQSRVEYARRAREGSIWRHDLKHNLAAKRVVELNPPGTEIASGQTQPPAVPVPGTWETSGIIDASDFFGRDSWLFVVQAHAPSLAPAPGTVEDGQLLLMLPSKPFENGRSALPGSDDDRD